MRHLGTCISFFSSMGRGFKSLTAKSGFAAMLILFSSASMANDTVDSDAPAFSEAFDGTTITGSALDGDGPLYTFPAAAPSWAGFANKNMLLYPLYFTEAGSITFTASVPSGGSADVVFRLEKNPFPDIYPSFNTGSVTVSGAAEASYTVDIPSQGANVYRSLLMYLDTRDVGVIVKDVAVTSDANSGGNVVPGPGYITLNVDMSGVDLSGQTPNVMGEFNGFCGQCAEMTDEDGDGIWSITLNENAPMTPGSYAYKFSLGGIPEVLDSGAECASVSYAGDGVTEFVNRLLVVDGDANLAAVPFGGCASGGNDTDTGGELSVIFSVDMTGVDLQGQVPTVNGTFNNWCGNCASMTDDDGDNVWTIDITLADGSYEYKYALGAWVDQETVPGACALDASAEFVNRTVTLAGADIALDTTPWSGCPGDEAGPTEPEPTPEDGFLFTEAFGGTTIDGSVYTFPDSADSWAGFANMNTSLYPITVAEDSVITFTGSVPAACARPWRCQNGYAVIRFRFVASQYPYDDPSFYTGTVTVSGADAATYSISVPSQGANTFNSFLLHLDTRDVGVSITDVAISAAPAGPVDSDNDGVNDDEDAFPNDASETADSDNDGVGDNADAFPNDASETVDSDNDGVGDNADYAPNDPAVQKPKQSVFVSGMPNATVGSPVSITVGYDVSDGDSSLTGLGLRVHYDSSVLTFIELSNVLLTDIFDSGRLHNDTDNHDGDASTDKYVTASWASLFGSWPGTLPADLLTATFNVTDVDNLVTTVINFSTPSTSAGYQFEATPYILDIFSGSFDFDGNGSADALTDGLLLVRYAFGLSGEKLVGDGVVASDSPLTTAEIQLNLEKAEVIMDIDGNGSIGALSDGLLLLRYMFGIPAEMLVNGVIAADATRLTAEDTSQHIELYMP
jgi:hypothetical protein